MTLSITPASTGNDLLIQVVGYFGHSANGTGYAMTLINPDSNAGTALAVATDNSGASGGGVTITPMIINHREKAPVTASTTYTIRSGGGSGSLAFNGHATTGQRYNSLLSSSITITETSGTSP